MLKFKFSISLFIVLSRTYLLNCGVEKELVTKLQRFYELNKLSYYLPKAKDFDIHIESK